MRKVKIEIGMTFQEVSCQTLQKKNIGFFFPILVEQIPMLKYKNI
jgi:hypothetical protein